MFNIYWLYLSRIFSIIRKIERHFNLFQYKESCQFYNINQPSVLDNTWVWSTQESNNIRQLFQTSTKVKLSKFVRQKKQQCIQHSRYKIQIKVLAVKCLKTSSLLHYTMEIMKKTQYQFKSSNNRAHELNQESKECLQQSRQNTSKLTQLSTISETNSKSLMKSWDRQRPIYRRVIENRILSDLGEILKSRAQDSTILSPKKTCNRYPQWETLLT